MFPFSQKMRFDQAALIPPAAGRGGDSRGRARFPEAPRPVLSELEKGGAPWDSGHPILHFSQLIPIFPRAWDSFCPGPPTQQAHTLPHPSALGLESPPR